MASFSSSSMPRPPLSHYYPPHMFMPHNYQYQEITDRTLPAPHEISQGSVTESSERPNKRSRLSPDDSIQHLHQQVSHRLPDPDQQYRIERDQSPSVIAYARSSQPSGDIESSGAHISSYHPQELPHENPRAHGLYHHEHSGHRRSYSAPGNELTPSTQIPEFDSWTPTSDSSPADTRRHQHYSLELVTTQAQGSERQILDRVAPEHAHSNPQTFRGSETSSSSSISANFSCLAGPDPNPYRDIKEPPSPGGLSQRSSIDSRVSVPRSLQLPPLVSLTGHTPTSGSDPYAYKSSNSPGSTHRPSSTSHPGNSIDHADTLPKQGVPGKRKPDFD